MVVNITQTQIATIAICISVLALTVAILNYRRKSSTRIRGGFGFASSVECEDRYIHTIVLENMKDRAVSIYGIHVLVGHNHLIKVEEFEESPMILRPYETWKRDYGPIEFYSVNMRRIGMEKVLGDEKIRKRLVLSTGDGRYTVKRYPKPWHPVLDHFRNHAFALIFPVRSTYKGKDVGGSVRFVVDLLLSSGKSEVILLREEDYRSKRFRRFDLTPESLASADALRAFLGDRMADGSLPVKSFDVVDAKDWRSRDQDFTQQESIEAEPLGFFTYHVLCRFFTWRRDREMRRKNKKAARERARSIEN